MALGSVAALSEGATASAASPMLRERLLRAESGVTPGQR